MPRRSKPVPSPEPALAGDLPQDLLTFMFNCSSDGVFAVDSDFRILAFNNAAAQTIGIEPKDAIGRYCHEVLRSNICKDCCSLRYTIETGRPIVDLAVNLLDDLKRHVPVTISTAVLKDAKGNIIGGVETFRNLNLVKKLLKEVESHHPFESIVTNDAHIKHLFEILPTIATSESSVLLYGDTGTGKNLFAKAIHNLSTRRKGPFVTVNCGAMPETLLESELFGYVRGAFTGATCDRKGRIAFAEKGTIFLDEIGDMPLSMQPKLLRFLQDRVYERLGDVRTLDADVRVVTATNRNLSQMVEEGKFRRDLFFRINVMSIELPLLRERKDDIPLLVQRFLERLSSSRNKQVLGISRNTLEILMKYDYPGNIRELENIIEHAFVLCQGPTIEIEHLPDHFQTQLAEQEVLTHNSLRDVESRFIVDVLKRNRWNRQEAARELGIHKTTLLRKIRRLGIKLPKIDGRTTRHKEV